MKVGRNDPCPCGSGKKYKKCCLARDQEQSATQPAPIRPSPSSTAPRHPKPAPAPAPPAKAPRPLDPVAERGEVRWKEFESQNAEGRIAVFRATLDDTVNGTAVMTDGLAFEMLAILHKDAVESGDRARFAEYVGMFRERRPEVYEEGAHYYLSWRLLDALAEGWQDLVPVLTRELAAGGERQIDTFSRAMNSLEYHGQLAALIEARRIAWPDVKSSHNVLGWAVDEFANKGGNHEIFDYLERTAAPDPADPSLLDRVKFFVADPRADYLSDFIADLTGTSGREWRVDDFTMRPPRKSGRDEWDDEELEDETPDPGVSNLYRLINEFVGYLRRAEGVPFPRGDMVKRELVRYFLERHEGDLDPRPSMLEQAMNPKLKLPKPPRPVHPLCPERVTLDVCLARLMGMMSGRDHSAAALFLAVPAWLRFLESRHLIDADVRNKVVTDLLPLHATLMRMWEKYPDDPTLYRQGQAWPADAARGLPEAAR